MEWLIKYGWHFLLIAITGEIVVPFVIAPFFTIRSGIVYEVGKSPFVLALVCAIFLAVFAIGACIFTCLFNVNESKEIITTASKIHGAGSAIGFMLLLFVPLFVSIHSYKTADGLTGMVSTAYEPY